MKLGIINSTSLLFLRCPDLSRVQIKFMLIVLICLGIFGLSLRNFVLELFRSSIRDRFPDTIKDILIINPVLSSVSPMERVPVLNVESKVDMEVLVVIVMENTVRLPGLPPGSFESDPGVVNDSVVIGVHHYHGEID